MDTIAAKRIEKLRRKGLRRLGRKAEITFEGTVTGLQSASGRFYVAIGEDAGAEPQPPTLIERDRLSDERYVFARLAEDRRFYLPSDQRVSLIREASKVVNYTIAHVIENVGFNGTCYAFRNGEWLEGRSKQRQAASSLDEGVEIKPHVAFERQQTRARKSGKRKSANRAIAQLLQGQDILTFALAVSLASLIHRFSRLRDANFGFQIIGPAACGKTTALQVASSVWGCPYDEREVIDIDFFTHLHLDDRLDLCNDQPLILDEADRWFALETPREKLERVRAFDRAFHHRTKSWGGTESRPTRMILLMAGREPLEELCGDDAAARQRLGDRLLTIPVPTDRPGKLVVEPDPAKFESLARYVDALRAELNRSFGHAARRMAQKVLDAFVADEAALEADIAKRIDEFIAKSGVDERDGPAFLAASRFGLAYAAAEFGRRCGALPRLLDTDAAILAVYNLHVGRPGGMTFEARLQVLLHADDMIDLGAGKLPKVPDQERAKALGYIRRCATHIEVLIPPKNMERGLPGIGRPEQNEEARAFLVPDKEKGKGGKRHWKVKRTLGRGRKEERVYVFRLPLPDEED